MPVEYLNPLLVKQEVVQITPQCAVAYGAWGRLVDNPEIRKTFLDGLAGKELQAARDFIKGTGIVARYHAGTPTIFLEHREQVAEEMVRAGTEAARIAMQVNGWDRADHLFLATSTPGDERGLWGQEIARSIGIPKAEYHLLACDGGVNAFLSALKRKEEFKGARVVIAAVEPLAHLLSPVDFKGRTIFGNGVAALAFRPDDVELINGKTRIEKDANGVIRTPSTYDLPGKVERLRPPSWYELGEGTEEVFAVSNNGVFLKLPEGSDLSYLQMLGEQTARYFSRVAPPVIIDVLKEGSQSFSGLKKILCVSHQPSLGVMELSLRRLERLRKEAGLPKVDAPWVLRRAKMSNCSSATPFVALAVLAKSGEITLGRVLNMTGYGVGSAATSMNIRFKK